VDLFRSTHEEVAMPQPRVSGRSVPSLHAVTGRPLAMTLPRSERRNPIRRAAIMRRIAAEFQEMPGLVLSVPQASRLLGIDQAACERILAGLAAQGRLRRRDGGSYGNA
jgi:hypothetical protein